MPHIDTRPPERITADAEAGNAAALARQRAAADQREAVELRREARLRRWRVLPPLDAAHPPEVRL